MKLTIYQDDGTPVADGAELAAGTYYAPCTAFDYEKCSQGSIEYKHDAAVVATRLGSFLFRWDSTLVAAITFEATNDPEVAKYAAAAAGWILAPAPAPSALSTLNIAGGSAGLDGRYSIDLPFSRLRFKAVVATGGVLEPYEGIKEG